MAFVIKDRVKETSTSTGTGALALAGAITGFQAFSAACAVGDTLYYSIQSVDASGVPTGDWECGLGTYSAANTLTRTTVTSSSNAGAAVSLAAGTKQVYITMPAEQVAWARERLTAARTYYVRTDGSDSNTGLANTAGAAFLTTQKAADVATGTLDAGTYQVTIQIADGTYTGATLVKPMLGTLPLIFRGNNATPANVHLNTTGSSFTVDNAATAIKVLDLKMSATSNCLLASPAGKIEFGNVVFGTATSRHINSAYFGYIGAISSYSITGGAIAHLLASGGTVLCSGLTITLTGTPAFATAFVEINRVGTVVILANTYSGSATGVRYSIKANGMADTNGAATTALPGDTAGTTATGGQYV